MHFEIILQPGEGLSILQLEKELRTQVDILAKTKHDRVKQLKKLKETDQHLCDVLCTTPYYVPTGTVPSLDQLKELEQHIKTLSDEKVCTLCLGDFNPSIWFSLPMPVVIDVFSFVGKALQTIRFSQKYNC